MIMEIRDLILKAVEEEVVGPAQNNIYRDEDSGEEILLASVHGSPKARYGAGMLYPLKTTNQEENDTGADVGKIKEDNSFSDVGSSEIIKSTKTTSSLSEKGNESEDEPVGMANQYLPSAMGFTVRFRAKEKIDTLIIDIRSAYYLRGNGEKIKKTINKDGIIEDVTKKDGTPSTSPFWVRKPINPEPLTIKVNTLFKTGKRSFDKSIFQHSDNKPWLTLRIFNRTTKEDLNGNFLTYTFVLINSLESSTDTSSSSDRILFQNKLTISTQNKDLIAPYPERTALNDTEEEQTMNLLYRKKRIYAIGHGTSVNWETATIGGKETVKKVMTTVIPCYDLPQIAPTSFVELNMFELSDLGDWKKAKVGLKNLIDKYADWVSKLKKEVQDSSELLPYRKVAMANVQKCEGALTRIKRGVEILSDASIDSEIVQSFRWMNRAMLFQQQRSKTPLRKWIRTGKNKHFVLEGVNNSDTENFSSLKNYSESSKRNGRWRPFQLAFILMNLQGTVDPLSEERQVVDLIWFPTGGGKTEAYLGLSALSIFYRRLRGAVNWNWDFLGGTTILMRYTLRLLTTQQYERAASLICACDLIRKENFDKLGEEPISIGLWVGGDSTPNTHDTAKTQFHQLQKKEEAAYNFVVMKCPCCGAQIGKIENSTIKGLRKEDGKKGKILFQCDNSLCEYSSEPLPLDVVDDYIYEKPPTLILGTVDKFAMIPWKKEAGQIFGFRGENNDWKRITPPELIIQDELHLISGPLGTMVGLYETMIQTLCNNYGRATPPFIPSAVESYFPPKIIASSATISRAYEQVKNLYGIDNRNQLNIFPPQGVEFGKTWFSEEKSLDIKDEDQKQIFPGRRYIGILASGYPSAQTAIVRTYASVLQKIKELKHSSEEKDYYWTLLGYFNSIRELGGASSLVHSDIRERLGQIQNRNLISRDERRYINRIEELTSRISSSEIPATLKKLEKNYSDVSNTALDICLATNMVATGVDISRLGLMFIHGQPKTTAEYIQASSRVGRELPSGAGLVFTLYSPSKPRDKSQYEQFQSYHSRIYSNVEPTSVTPFSINARDRALHAIIIGMVRHFSSYSLRTRADISSNQEDFEYLTGIITDIILKRCQILDPKEKENTKMSIEKVLKFWEAGFDFYGDAFNYMIRQGAEDYPLMYNKTSEHPPEVEKRSLPTPTSMRGVDSESSINIYSYHNE